MHEDQTERKSNKNAIDLKADQLQRLQLVELELAGSESETLVSLIDLAATASSFTFLGLRASLTSCVRPESI